MQREREMVESPGLNLRVIKARAKHFQDSLFSTVKSPNTTKMGTVSEREMRKDSSSTESGSTTVSNVDGYRSHEVPTLNVHGLITNTEASENIV
jgi:hypothetical protein